MYYFANTSLLVSGEQSFVVTAVSMGLINTETRLGFDYFGFIIGPVIGILGICGNIVNTVIFYRQGLNNTMNISFFSLAISDLGILITMTASAICISPPMVYSGLPLDFPTFAYFTLGWPHVIFANITSWITVYITAERCLCIALPLKVKEIITPRVTSSIISVIYLLNIMPSAPDFIYTYMDWKFISKRNRTVLALASRENFKFLEGVTHFFLSCLGFLPFPTVIVFTVILVVKLQQQTLWRQKSIHDIKKAQLTSKREIRTMNMVVLIAVVLIICNIPGVIVSTTTYIIPSFNINGRYFNIWFVAYYFVFVMHGINSSVNIFLYYKMSSKFKRDFHELFEYCICVPRNIDGAD